MQEALAILEELGSLDPAEHIRTITEVNPTADNPYYNAQHCLTVAIRVYEGAFKWFGVDRTTGLAAVLAGLYHDYNHTSPDDNISRPLAILGATEHIKRIESASFPRGVMGSISFESFLEEIVEMIEDARQAKRRKAPENYISRFVYDAEHMQILEPDASVFLEGLSKETGRKVTIDSYIEELKKKKLFTKWSKEYALAGILNN